MVGLCKVAMNSLIEGHDRQLSTMLEEILVTGDPGLSASADGDRAGGDGRLHRADSLSDESSYLLDQDNDFSSPIERKRKPIRGSTTYPNGVAFTTGSLGLSSAAGVAPLTGRSTLPSGAGHQPGDDSGEQAVSQVPWLLRYARPAGCKVLCATISKMGETPESTGYACSLAVHPPVDGLAIPFRDVRLRNPLFQKHTRSVVVAELLRLSQWQEFSNIYRDANLYIEVSSWHAHTVCTTGSKGS